MQLSICIILRMWSAMLVAWDGSQGKMRISHGRWLMLLLTSVVVVFVMPVCGASFVTLTKGSTVICLGH